MRPTRKYSRRKFMQKSSAGTISLALGSSYLISACGTKNKPVWDVVRAVENGLPDAIHNISCQLYTFRMQLAEDVSGTIQKVANTGLKYVETFDFAESLSVAEGTKPLDPFSFAKLLNDLGLSVSSMHA